MSAAVSINKALILCVCVCACAHALICTFTIHCMSQQLQPCNSFLTCRFEISAPHTRQLEHLSVRALLLSVSGKASAWLLSGNGAVAGSELLGRTPG